MSVTNVADLPSEPKPAQSAVRGRGRARVWEIIRPLLLAAGAVAIGAVWVLFLTGVDQVGAAAWVERFSTSPGAAGVAAVVASAIGFWALARQLHHNKGVELDAAWWKSFEWVADRALPNDKSDGLPYLVAVDMLAPLVKSANNATQERICGAFLDHLAELDTRTSTEESPGRFEPAIPESTEDSPTTPPQAPESPADSTETLRIRLRPQPFTWLKSHYDHERGDRALSTLENYAQLSSASSGRSYAVEAQLYSLRVVEAVRRVVKDAFMTFGGDRSADITVITGDGRHVHIAASGATTHLAAVSAALSISRTTKGTTLVVTRGETEDPGTKIGERLFTVRWRDERDDQELELGIQRALEATPPESSADLSG